MVTVLTFLLGFAGCSTSVATLVPTDTSDTGTIEHPCGLLFSPQCEVRPDGTCYDPVYLEPGSGHRLSVQSAVDAAQTHQENPDVFDTCLNTTIRPCDENFAVVAEITTDHIYTSDVFDRQTDTLVGWLWVPDDESFPFSDGCNVHFYFGPPEAESCAVDALEEVHQRHLADCGPLHPECDLDVCIDVDSSVQ